MKGENMKRKYFIKKRVTALLIVSSMLLGIVGCASNEKETPKTQPSEETTEKSETTEAELLESMERVIMDEEHPLAAASLGIIKDGEIIFADTVGRKWIDNDNSENDISTDENTKYRIASISKLCAAIGVWQLIEQGKIDVDADASDYLGFELRNPSYADIPITVSMLLSHTSSIREGGDNSGSYSIPYGHKISEFFQEGSEYYCDGCWAPEGEKPGEYFSYANMNYGLLATIVEKVSGERFDLYMQKHVFEPMGLTCSYNVAAMDEEDQKAIGTLYRKKNEQDEYDPKNGKWIAQVDDYSEGYPDEKDYADYEIGTNGSLFSPQGGLRISVVELCNIMQMFCAGGSYNGQQILKPETIEKMFEPYWNYDEEKENGDTYYDLMLCYGRGPQVFTNRGGDRLVEGQDLPFSGHTAEAYGLLGGMGFDRETGNGLVYIVAGTGCDMDEYLGEYSSFYRWEEELLTMGADYAQFDY